MRKGISIVGLATLPLAALGQERGFDYTYVEASYLSSEVEAGPFDADGDGLGLRGSFAMSDLLHLFAEYSTQDHDFGIDTSALSVGVGLHKPLQSKLDFFGELGWVSAEVDTPVGDVDDDGIGLSAGLRFRASDSVELEGAINHVNLDDSDTSLSLRGRYYFNRSFALTGGLLLNDDDTGWHVGVRAEFGGR